VGRASGHHHFGTCCRIECKYQKRTFYLFNELQSKQRIQTMTASDTLLVTGASGHLGQAVLRHLLDTLAIPPQRIVAATRKPTELGALQARGVTVRAADFDDRAISTDRLDVPGIRLRQHEAAIAAAAAAGVQHVVYTSMPKPQTSLVTFAPDHAGSEAALASSGLPGWTVLRNHWYYENLFHSIPSVLASGKWFTAAGAGKVADIARDALAGTGTDKTIRTLSGAQAYSIDEVAARIARATGRPIEVVQVPIEGLVQGMVAHGLPEPVARVYASFDAATAAGGFGQVTGDYRALTGRDPQPFETWVEANRAALLGRAA
jgi:NAD(P)H dehydrogenase (quinone)